jgi:hypothetical protein
MRYVFQTAFSPAPQVHREFDVQNRMEGTVGYFTVSAPIGIDTNSQSTPGNIVKAKF